MCFNTKKSIILNQTPTFFLGEFSHYSDQKIRGKHLTVNLQKKQKSIGIFFQFLKTTKLNKKNFNNLVALIKMNIFFMP
jgi:hypothetical protein